MEDDGDLARVALIHSSRDPSEGGPSLFVIMLTWDSDEGKLSTMELIRRACEERNADAVLMMGELWSVPEEDNDAMLDSGLWPSQHPHRFEVVDLNLETPGAYYFAMPRITQAGDVRTFAMPAFRILGLDEIEGRLTGLLARNRT